MDLFFVSMELSEENKDSRFRCILNRLIVLILYEFCNLTFEELH